MDEKTMSNIPVDEARVDAFETDLVEVILKHRIDDRLSTRDTAATIINVLFTMATSQPNPKEAVDNLKIALDDVCKAWYDAGKPDILKGMLVRAINANKDKGPDELEPKKDL